MLRVRVMVFRDYSGAVQSGNFVPAGHAVINSLMPGMLRGTV